MHHPSILNLDQKQIPNASRVNLVPKEDKMDLAPLFSLIKKKRKYLGKRNIVTNGILPKIILLVKESRMYRLVRLIKDIKLSFV